MQWVFDIVPINVPVVLMTQFIYTSGNSDPGAQDCVFNVPCPAEALCGKFGRIFHVLDTAGIVLGLKGEESVSQAVPGAVLGFTEKKIQLVTNLKVGKRVLYALPTIPALFFTRLNISGTKKC